MADILSQEEIDALLNALSTGELSVEEIKREEEEKKIREYDFRRPSKFSKEQIRVFDMVHENFARSLSNYLSGKLRTFVNINIASIDQITFGEFLRSIPSPSFIVVFSAPEFHGNTILEINPEIVYTIVDRLLGGPGSTGNLKRPPTDIEMSVMRKEVNVVLNLLSSAWEHVFSFNPAVESVETNAQFVQIAPQSEMSLLVTFFVSVGNVEAFMNVCWLSSTLEPFAERLSTQAWFVKKGEISEEEKKKLRENLETVQVELVAELGRSVLTLRELLTLEVGDVIRLNTKKDEDVTIRVQGKPRFLGRLGKFRGYNAVRVRKLIHPDELEKEGWE
ncbi:MAG: flagellar motor switch protein FliM [Thermotogota bacterium]|nr:flagellar motor switch protein FliM [Thermotogota bacterium]MDK2864301.1 flagellar motor switch protein FliM [Thermotogota bacterium]HCZ05567.1 flagellar motor switch protein FliM [Thermotogota bacterium]